MAEDMTTHMMCTKTDEQRVFLIFSSD